MLILQKTIQEHIRPCCLFLNLQGSLRGLGFHLDLDFMHPRRAETIHMMHWETGHVKIINVSCHLHAVLWPFFPIGFQAWTRFQLTRSWMWPPPSWLDSSVGRAQSTTPVSQPVMGSTPWIVWLIYFPILILTNHVPKIVQTRGDCARNMKPKLCLYTNTLPLL